MPAGNRPPGTTREAAPALRPPPSAPVAAGSPGPAGGAGTPWGEGGARGRWRDSRPGPGPGPPLPASRLPVAWRVAGRRKGLRAGGGHGPVSSTPSGLSTQAPPGECSRPVTASPRPWTVADLEAELSAWVIGAGPALRDGLTGPGPASRALPLPPAPVPCLSGGSGPAGPPPCRQRVCPGNREVGGPHSGASGAASSPCRGERWGDTGAESAGAQGAGAQEPPTSTACGPPVHSREPGGWGLLRASGESSPHPPSPAPFTPFLWLSPCKCPAPQGGPRGNHTPTPHPRPQLRRQVP